MAGFFSAQTGALATGLTVCAADHLDQVRDKDLVLIGNPSSQPLLSEWASTMPVGLSGAAIHVNAATESTLFLHPQWPFRTYDSRRLRRLIGLDTSPDLLVESFVSPLRADRVVVAVVPGSEATNAVRALFTPSEREGPVYGGVAVSQNGRFESFLVGTQAYHAGELSQYQLATILVIEDYWLIPLFLLVFALMIAAWVRWSTGRVAAERLAAQGT
jgi:hypothetical protein